MARSTTTSKDGVYNLPFLSPGNYLVEVEAAGFKKFSRDSVLLDVSTTARVDAVLTLGSTSETITISAAPPALQTDRAEVARNFTTQPVQELPLANRNFQGLVGLMAGVGPPSPSGNASEDPQGTTFFNATGQANSANQTLVDGMDDTDAGRGFNIYLPSPEVVDEIHIATSNYSAEFGRVAGAVVNVATRAGTNTLHGTLWEFNRLSALTARDFFNTVGQPKPDYKRNDFGVAVGGPVVKDKTFFFGAYNGRYLRQSSTSTNTIPLPAFLGADFSSVPGLALYDPSTGGPNGSGRQPFPNNSIPQSRLNPIAQKIATYLPQPDLPGILNNYVLNVPFDSNSNNYDARVDHYFSELTKMFVKFSTSQVSAEQDGVLGSVLGNGTLAHDYTVTSLANVTHGFSPTLLSELRLGYNRWRTNISGIDTTTLTNAKLGIVNPNPDDISSKGMASIAIKGMPSIGMPTQYPLIYTGNLFEAENTWSKTTGKHVFKWGGEVHRNRRDRAQPQGLNLGPRGLFNFDPGTTQLLGGPGLGSYGSFVNSFASFLLGDPDEVGRTLMVITPTTRQTQVAAFVQDTYQVTQRLTLDIGLRYEFYSPVVPRYRGGASNYDPNTNSLLIAGYGDVGLNMGVGAQDLGLAPRVGFAYRLGEKQVIRGGYGISYWTGRSGFTGGTLDTQFPTIYNVQQGNTGVYTVTGSLGSIPPVQFISIPSSGIINPAPNQAFYVIPFNNPLPSVQNFNLTYQRQLSSDITFDVGYVGALGRYLPYNQSLNAAAPGAGSAGLPFFVRFGRTQQVTLRADGVNSNYNALQANLTKRFSNGFSLTVAYAYSKSLDVGSNQANFIDNLDFQRQYGPSDFDRTHLLTVSHLYELPFGKGKKFFNHGGIGAAIVGGWQLNGIFREATGMPFTATADATSCNCPGNSQFADALTPVQYLGGVGPGQPWFSQKSFAVPGPNRFGTAGRNTLRGPALTNYDFSVFRTFAVNERFKLEYRAEFYDLTNTPQFSNPSTSVSAANFGIISSTLTGYGNRQIQMALRLKF